MAIINYNTTKIGNTFPRNCLDTKVRNSTASWRIFVYKHQQLFN